MKRLFRISLTIAALSVFAASPAAERLTDYVDMRIGTGGHGHVFMGANVPYGMVQAGPTSIHQDWDHCSGYHASDSTLIGFSHTHLSGTGIGDLFDVTVIPVVGEVTYARGSEAEPGSGLWSAYSHKNEAMQPGYYKTRLDRYGVNAEITATERAAMHRYEYPAGAVPSVVIDLENGGCWDSTVETEIEQVSPTRIAGHRRSKGWAADQQVWFVIEFSRPVESFSRHGRAGMYGRADFAPGEPLLMKVAISPVSRQGALRNLEAEMPGWDFAGVKAEALRKWESELSKIRIKSGDRDVKRNFYTGLYHTMILPSLFCDVDGMSRGADGKPFKTEGFTPYTVFSLWDTYRAALPLQSIIGGSRYADFINSMLDICNRQGRLPVWHLWGNETDCMVGNPGIVAVADAVVRKVPGVDRDRALEAMIRTANDTIRGAGARDEHGYLPADVMKESVAFDLEYALADGALANAARSMGREETAREFDDRSRSYRRLFDKNMNFIRGRMSDRSWHEPFNPFFSAHRDDDFCEGNAWTYLWLAPHDINGLKDCFGSRSAMLCKLDSLFILPSEIPGHPSPDISGFIGQYAHGNEPGHHIPYIYAMMGEPEKTADLVRRILKELYSPTPDGLCGNEDAGQMSAWYVLSALGLYQVEPGSGRYWFGSPIIDGAEIATGGKPFRISVRGNSDRNRYVKEVRLNKKPYDLPYIDYADIMAGGELELVMCDASALPREEYGRGRPAKRDRLFESQAVEDVIASTCAKIQDPKLREMFANCFPNTLDTTVHFDVDSLGNPDTFVYTGDIHAMWLRDSGAQVWPYVKLASKDKKLADMLKGVVLRQFKSIILDPYANAFNAVPNPDGEWMRDLTAMRPELHERKWEIDSHCYPIRLAYEYWQQTGDASVFGEEWIAALQKTLQTFRAQQRKDGHKAGYRFMRRTERASDTQLNDGYGAPVNPVGLIASAFRPSDDATMLPFLVPSNFFAVTSLRKAERILREVNKADSLADECRQLADEVESALWKHAVFEHPKYGKVFAYEVDGFGGRIFMDDANVPSLLAMPYLGDIAADNEIYLNTRKMLLSEDNPYFFKGKAGEGIGGPHIGYDYVWPMSIMMRAFTATDPQEKMECLRMLRDTDAGTGFMHESFHKDDARRYTRSWFAWQNSLFGELLLRLLSEGHPL